MEIRRKIFSVIIDEDGAEKLFSVSETELVEEKEFSKKEEKKSEEKKNTRYVALEDVQSHRGLGRSLILSAPVGGVGAVGGYIGKRAANKADSEGLSDKDIYKKSVTAARRSGGLLGAAVAAGATKTVAGTAVGAVIGAASASMGAKKNTRKRLEKRAFKERQANQKDQ